jgi:nucleoid DNA-binding protein
MGKLTIQDIAKVLSDRKGLSKNDASNFVNGMFDIIQQALERDMVVKVKGFGTFKIIDVDPRESVNVNTGERVLIEGHNKITFTPDQLLKEIVNKPFSQFETVVLNEGVDFAEDTTSEAYVTPEVKAASMPLVDFVDEDPSFENPIPLGENTVAEAPTPDAEPMPVETSVPVVESEPVSSSTSMVVEAPVAEVSETPANEESVEDSEEESVYEDEEEGSGSRKWLMAAVALLLGLGVGYLLGNYFPMKGEQPVEAPKPPVEMPKTVVEDTLVVDSIKAAVSAPEAEQPAEPIVDKPVEAPKPEVKAEETKPVETVKPAAVAPKPVAPEVDKYAAMDARVRTGAYRIVGTDKVVKVKEGDNLRRIAQRTLGPDMECYLEVYNGLKAASPLKIGQEIKIPKLQLKKKKTQTTN